MKFRNKRTVKNRQREKRNNENVIFTLVSLFSQINSSKHYFLFEGGLQEG